nr:reverse transcriptase domain-containing protein [Tanacetum cinerariifolium]
MRTRNSYFLNNSFVTISRRRNKRHTPNVVEPELRTIVKVAPMADNRTIEEVLQAPTKGYGEAIVVPKINAAHFKIKTSLIQLVQANPYHGFERENPHTHINNFKMITSTLKFKDMPNDLIKFMMFSYSLEGNARVSNTTPNSMGEMKAITTRSVVPYEGPSIPTPKKVVEREIEETTVKEQTNFQGSTAHIQPPVTLILEPDFRGCFTLDAKISSTIKSLLTNKDKLFELAKIPLNENFSAMLLKKLPEKLRDPCKFLIPSDRSITRPKGVAEDVFVKVGKFHFPTNFVHVDFEADPRVPLILGRSFLRTGHALIDVYGEEINLRVNDKAVTFNLNQTMRYSSTYDDLSVNRIDIINVAREEYAQEILGFSNSSSGGNPTSNFEPIFSDSSHSLTAFEGSDFILEEIKAYLKDESISPEINQADCDPEGDICLIEKLLNNDPFQLPPIDLKQGEAVKAKSSIEEPLELELKDLPSHLEYAYLEDGFSGYFQIPINPPDQEKTTFSCPYGTFAYRRMPFGLYNAPGTFQRCMMVNFHDMIEKTMEVFMDDFSVFGDSFSSYLSHLDTMLQRCEDTNLVLNWEKCQFMVKEGIVLGHKISKNELKVDRSKVDVIAKFPYLTTVKGVRSFLRHAGFYRRFIQDFSKVARPMTHLLEKETPFVFSKDCIDAFETKEAYRSSDLSFPQLEPTFRTYV